MVGVELKGFLEILSGLVKILLAVIDVSQIIVSIGGLIGIELDDFLIVENGIVEILLIMIGKGDGAIEREVLRKIGESGEVMLSSLGEITLKFVSDTKIFVNLRMIGFERFGCQ